jgi:hypothetical protein
LDAQFGVCINKEAMFGRRTMQTKRSSIEDDEVEGEGPARGARFDPHLPRNKRPLVRTLARVTHGF